MILEFFFALLSSLFLFGIGIWRWFNFFRAFLLFILLRSLSIFVGFIYFLAFLFIYLCLYRFIRYPNTHGVQRALGPTGTHKCWKLFQLHRHIFSSLYIYLYIYLLCIPYFLSVVCLSSSFDQFLLICYFFRQNMWENQIIITAWKEHIVRVFNVHVVDSFFSVYTIDKVRQHPVGFPLFIYFLVRIYLFFSRSECLRLDFSLRVWMELEKKC